MRTGQGVTLEVYYLVFMKKNRLKYILPVPSKCRNVVALRV